jgi:hypothetical protein
VSDYCLTPDEQFDSDAMNALHFNGDELHLFLLKA